MLAMAKMTKPAVVVTQRKWDETRHLVAVEVVPGQAARDHVEVMVSSFRMVIRWANGAMLVLDVVSPPCPLLSPSSSNIYAALHGHPLLVRYVSAIAQLRTCATTSIHINEFDGAPGNDKLNAFDREKTRGSYHEHHLCCNHQQHLVSLSVLSVLSLQLTTHVLTSGYFLSYNSHWSRLLTCIGSVVDSKFQVKYEVRQQHWNDYAVEWAHFVLRNERMDKDYDDDCDEGRRLQTKLFQALSKFLDVFNGPWWEAGSWVHYCSRDGSCCGKLGDSDETRAQLAKRKAVDVIKGALLRKRPGKASANKWSKLAPAFQFFVFGAAPHDMLHTICQESLKAARATYEKAYDDEELRLKFGDGHAIGCVGDGGGEG